MDCKETLTKALELTGGDRAKQHGNKRDNHQNIANLWNGYLLNLGMAQHRVLTPHDIALMMVLLKIARTASGSINPDDYVDGAGYMGVAAEVV